MAELIRLELRKGSYQMPSDKLPYETEAAKIAEVLAANGYGKLEAPSRELKFLRGERKTLSRELDSFESQEHTTVTIKYLRRFLGRRPE